MEWKCSKCQTENKDTCICSVIRNVEYPEKLRKSLMLDEKKIFEILKEKQRWQNKEKFRLLEITYN